MLQLQRSSSVTKEIHTYICFIRPSATRCPSVCLSVCVGITPVDRCPTEAEGYHSSHGAAAAVPDPVLPERGIPGTTGLEGGQNWLQPYGEPLLEQLLHDTSTGQGQAAG